jgi:peptidoglycan/LPS O-acetylase OafA/YrhL
VARQRFDVLDGWRGISILLVLASHLLPLGPKAWQLNVAAGLLGMVLFFILSGFLITHFLLRRPDVLDFLIRRFFRILPLAWLYMAFVFLIYPVSSDALWAHLLFYANYPPKPLIPATDHLWSLCVEVHFYIGIAIVVGLFKKRGWMGIPVLCLAFTLLRIIYEVHFSVITHFRIDDILAGALLALVYNDKLGQTMQEYLKQCGVFVMPLLLISCHPESGFIQYLRPYLAASLVGATLYARESFFIHILHSRILRYLATVSYALYIIHPFLMTTWLGSGEHWAKYIKRPLLFVVLFISAHLSFFYYEKKWIDFGKKLSGK